jgi:hypothetical protein
MKILNQCIVKGVDNKHRNDCLRIAQQCFCDLKVVDLVGNMVKSNRYSN